MHARQEPPIYKNILKQIILCVFRPAHSRAQNTSFNRHEPRVCARTCTPAYAQMRVQTCNRSQFNRRFLYSVTRPCGMPLAQLWSLVLTDGKLYVKTGEDVLYKLGPILKVQTNRDKPSSIEVSAMFCMSSTFKENPW